MHHRKKSRVILISPILDRSSLGLNCNVKVIEKRKPDTQIYSAQHSLTCPSHVRLRTHTDSADLINKVKTSRTLIGWFGTAVCNLVEPWQCVWADI